MMKYKILDEIIGAKFSDIIFQPTKNIMSPTNMYSINFVKGKKLYSLHTFCFLRFICANKIILTSTDECFDKDYKPVDSYEKSSSLVDLTISNVKRLAIDAIISKIEFLGCGDLIITLSNNITIEVRPDCLMESFEYYRLFEYGDPANQIIVSFNIGE